MNTRCILPLIALAAVAVGVSFKPILLAQSSPTGDAATDQNLFPRPFGPGGIARQMLGRLHLTAEQRQAGRAALRSHQTAIKPLVDGLAKERTALRELSKASTVDEAAIRVQAARVAGIEADLAVQRAYLGHDLRALATPEQLQTFDQMQTENISRRAEIVQRISAWIADS